MRIRAMVEMQLDVKTYWNHIGRELSGSRKVVAKRIRVIAEMQLDVRN